MSKWNINWTRSCSKVVAFACVILSLLLEGQFMDLLFCEGFTLCKCSSTGRPLGVYDLGVATPTALVYAGLMTSEDARSWYMISGDAKSWVLCVFAYIHCEVNDHSLRIVVLRLIWTPAWAFGFVHLKTLQAQAQESIHFGKRIQEKKDF
ncbi:hypothetical protein Tco_0838820 [Tanacetum coccineum]|uniref:Uncharacterized protein n=1 Tax=Tanacetum coccineum TaxID=301880 RepID=A0ABQ5APS9_9ASTR